MILSKIRIQNFKSIIDTGWLHLSKSDLVTVLAGQNESGKTSFLRALRFFEEGAYSTLADDDIRIDCFPRVDLLFHLNDEEYEQLKNDTNKALADYYKKEGFQFIRGDVDAESYDSFRYAYPDQAKTLVEKYNEKLDEEAEKFAPFDYFSDIRPEMVFYSSFSENILPGKANYGEVQTNQAIQDFENIYDVDFQELMKPATTDQKRTKATEQVRKKAADSLNSYWHQKISGEEADYKYQIQILPQADLAASYVNFYIDQGDDIPLRLSQKSQGFQWFSGFVLRLRAHESALKKSGLILLIDEPGQGLHEVAQQDVKNVIEEVSEDSKIQVIYSTHQPILLGKSTIDFSRLLLVDRDNEHGSQFKTISQLISSNGSLDALAPVRSALGLVTLSDPLKKKMTVVVEGITEFYYFKTFFGDKYTTIPSAGVDQIPNIFNILFGWGVDSKAVVDDDTQGRKAFNRLKKEFFGGSDQETSKRVLKIINSDGIESQLSEDDIEKILVKYGKKFNKNITKVDNVKQVGKFIFAKSFFDEFSGNKSNLSRDTLANFKEIESFLQQP